jgi:hypothetical protein
VGEIAEAGQKFAKFLFDQFGVPGGLLAIVYVFQSWLLLKAGKRIEALSDKLFSLGDRSTDKLSSIAGERLTADLSLAKALEDLTEKVEGLPRGRGR